MPRTTNNASQTIDYIDTIAVIGEPFQSTLLDKYPEYLTTSDATKTTTFLGALNLIGQSGCKFLYDKVINYIDDVSNVDTCKLGALYSIASTLQVPYKDKETLETLKTFQSASDILQLIVWAMSCNVRNSKHIAKRLELATADELTLLTSRSALFDSNGTIATAIKTLLKNIITKRHVAEPASQSDTHMLLNYTWNFLPLVVDVINSNHALYSKFMYASPCVHKLDFGKYNFTPHEHTCVKLIKVQNQSAIELTSELIRSELPFLFNDETFDPIKAAEAILFTDEDIGLYTVSQQTAIRQCITAINTTGHYVLDTYSTSTLSRIKWINKLNTHAFADERLLNNIVMNLKTMVNIDPVQYMTVAGFAIDDLYADSIASTWWNNAFKQTTLNPQFGLITTLTTEDSSDSNSVFFDVDNYVNDVYDSLLKFAGGISIIREDLKLLTLRNALKGTSAIIQLATAEYLNEHLSDIVDTVLDDVIPEEYRLAVKSDTDLISALTTIYDAAILDPSDVTIKEYWDTTEYYGRTKNDPTDDYPADWNTQPPTVYGSTSVLADDGVTRDSSDIVRFYTNTLGLSTDTFKNNTLDADVDLSTDLGMKFAQSKLINFLNSVYNAGIYDKSLPTNLEKIFSGNPSTAVLRQFYTNFKTYSAAGVDRISKQIHPYIWNFTTQESSLVSLSTPGTHSNSPKADSTGSVTNIQQDTDIVLLDQLISSVGNILDQWKLNISKYIDDSNYWTRYEAYDHTNEERLICYDGYVYPPFAKHMLEHVTPNADILGTLIVDETLHRKWYKRYGNHLLRDDLYSKENKILSAQLKSIQDSVDPTIHEDIDLADRTTLQNYAVDNNGTSYAVGEGLDGSVIIYYKEAQYPFMRPLRQTIITAGETEQLGMTFIDTTGHIITDFDNINFNYVADKNHFPNIIVSEDSNYIVIRLAEKTLGVFFVTTWVNSIGYSEKALQLLYIIDCDGLVGTKNLDDMSSHITEGGVKTLRDSIAILLTDVTETSFDEYLLSISPTSCSITKQSIDCSTVTQALTTMTAGLTLGDGAQTNVMSVIITTFGLTSDVLRYSYINSLTAGSQQTTSLQTSVNNTASSDSSFDISKQFIHMLANSNQNAIATLSTPTLKPEPLGDDRIIHYAPTSAPVITRTFTFTDTGFSAYVIVEHDTNVELYDRTVLPIAKRFNLNSDAGFNPCYIGDSGKLILPNRISQNQLSKTAGVAIELLGPKAEYDGIEDESGDQHEYDTRIHETDYTAVVDLKSDIVVEPTAFKSAADYSVYAKDSNAYTKKRPRLFTQKLDHFCRSASDDTYDDTLDIMSPNAKYIINDTDVTFKATDSGTLPSGKVGVAYVMFKTGENQIWMPTTNSADTILANAEFNKQVFNILFKGDKAEVSCKYAILKTNGTLGDPYIFDTLHIKRAIGNKIIIKLSGSIIELINIEIVVVGVLANIETNGVPTTTPTFMLTGAEFATSLLNDLDRNSIDFHNRAGHASGPLYGDKYDGDANRKTPSVNYIPLNNSDPAFTTGTYTIDSHCLTNGSLVMSITEKDSVVLGEIIPDQLDVLPNTGKSVLAELLNELFRVNRLNGNNINGTMPIDELYAFTYFHFEYLNMINRSYAADTPDSLAYYVQLATADDSTDIDYLKQLTYSAWRIAEMAVDQTLPTTPVENTLPQRIKVTQHDSTITAERPVYMSATAINGGTVTNIIPKLGIRWKTISDSSIQLRFDNATLADSIFQNDNNNLEYTSLANASSSMELNTSDGPELFSIVSPIHIIAGFTVFTDIPLSTLLLTNVSDDKPKFMLTTKSNVMDVANGDAYALVFDSASMPEIENLNSITAHCYVAKLNDLRQTVLPQIDTAVQLKHLAFNLTISNILNTNLIDTVDARHESATVQIASIYGKTPTHIITDMKETTATRNNNNETIKVVLKANASDTDEIIRKDKCFSVADFFIHFHDVTKYTLKNALISANINEVLAMDYNNNKLYIAKVFGCDFNKIGIKRVLGTYTDDTTAHTNMSVKQNHWLIPSSFGEPEIPIKTYINGELVEPDKNLLPPRNVLTGTQADTSRNTAILVNSVDDEYYADSTPGI